MRITIIIVAILIIALGYWYFIYRPSKLKATLVEGASCITTGTPLPGKITNGVCVPIVVVESGGIGGKL